MLAKNFGFCSQSQSTKKARVSIQPSADMLECVSTFGEKFPNGETIELIKASAAEPPKLHFFDGKCAKINSEMTFAKRVFRPAILSQSIQQIVKLPEKYIEFGTTIKLFAEIQQFFAGNGVEPAIALAAVYFSFASWFADVAPAAPCLLITGPRLEAELLLQLLACVVRRPLPISELNQRALSALPMPLQPTLLINAGQLGSASFELLRKSNRHGAFILRRGELVDIFCAKAIFCESMAERDVMGEGMFHVGLQPASGQLPILDGKCCDEATREFQSKLLAYRCRYILDVQQSQFESTEFPAETRVLARIFGAPLVQAPELHKCLFDLLRDREEDRKAFQWTDPRFVTLEAVIHHAHKEPGARVHVGKITETVNAILKGRGDTFQCDPREIGPILKNFGLHSKRYAGGFAIRLDVKTCAGMHRIANSLGVLAKRRDATRCPFCEEISGATKFEKKSR
jgi:hypothetical protein